MKNILKKDINVYSYIRTTINYPWKHTSHNTQLYSSLEVGQNSYKPNNQKEDPQLFQIKEIQMQRKQIELQKWKNTWEKSYLYLHPYTGELRLVDQTIGTLILLS